MPGKRLPEEERREAILEAAFRVAVRDTLGGLSMRAVAEEAGVSKGLIFFYFEDKERLLLELLDWALERGPRVEIPPELEAMDEDRPRRRLAELLAHQLKGLPERRERAGLFLDFWVMGTGMPEFRDRIRSAFDRYRNEYVPYTRPVAEALPGRFDEAGAGGLAALMVSVYQGFALQLISDPDRFDVDRYMAAVRAMVLADVE